jgi:glycosyltransferase involved in cell wall biosynthesis
MRILAVGLLYPPHYLGGYELVCEGVMRAATARGHDVEVIVSDYRKAGVSKPDEVPVDRVLRSYLDATAQSASVMGPARRLGLERANAAALERRIRAFAPDVVSWWGMGGLSLSLIERVRRTGLPSVVVVHDPWLSYGFQADGWTRMTRRLQPLARVLEPLCGVPIDYRLAAAGRFLFNSEHTLAAAAAAGVEPVDSAVITPGVHARFLTSAPVRPWGWRLLYVGRINPDKGIDLAVAALADLPPQAVLTIAGAGDDGYEAELSDQAESLGIRERVVFVGPVEADALPELYAAADAVLFPIRWDEPWGLVPLEAMGIGRPVVAVRRGGAATYLRDEENSLLIPPEDPGALAAAVRRLAADVDLRARLRAGGARTAAEHSAVRFEQRTVDELELAGSRWPESGLAAGPADRSID